MSQGSRKREDLFARLLHSENPNLKWTLTSRFEDFKLFCHPCQRKMLQANAEVSNEKKDKSVLIGRTFVKENVTSKTILYYNIP